MKTLPTSNSLPAFIPAPPPAKQEVSDNRLNQHVSNDTKEVSNAKAENSSEKPENWDVSWFANYE
jgi:hypothetical protein